MAKKSLGSSLRCCNYQWFDVKMFEIYFCVSNLLKFDSSTVCTDVARAPARNSLY